MDGLDSQVNWNKLREFLLRPVKICVRLITTCFISNLIISRRFQDESIKERKRRSLHALHACVGHQGFRVILLFYWNIVARTITCGLLKNELLFSTHPPAVEPGVH